MIDFFLTFWFTKARIDRFVCIGLRAVLLMASLPFPKVIAEDSSSVRVHWAGWSFAGDASAAPVSYSRSFAVHAQEVDAALIQARLAEIAAKAIPAGVELVRGELIQKTRGSGLAMTLALDGEYVSVDRMSSFYSVRIWLSAQIMVFDFGSARLLASFPVGAMLTTAMKAEPSAEYLQGKVRGMLLGKEDADNVNLLDEFGRRLQGLKLRREYDMRVQLRTVRLADKTLAKMPASMRSDARAVRAFTQFVGGSFGKALSSQAEVPTLPYLPPVEGEGGAMAVGAGQSMAILMGQVADATVYNLLVPEPDYVFDLEVAGFSKAVISESLGVKKWVYASYVDAVFLEPLRGSVYLRQRLVNPSFEDIPDGASIDDWAAYRSSLYQLLSRLAGGLSAAPSQQWIEAQPAAAALKGQLKASVTKLDLCR